MPSVAEELAELRKQKAVATHANFLQTKQGLSTPEQEAAALRAAAERDRGGNYRKDADNILHSGVKEASMDVNFSLQQGAKKKEDKSKKMEAAQKLQSFRGVVDPAPGTYPSTTSTTTTPKNTSTTSSENPPAATEGVVQANNHTTNAKTVVAPHVVEEVEKKDPAPPTATAAQEVSKKSEEAPKVETAAATTTAKPPVVVEDDVPEMGGGEEDDVLEALPEMGGQEPVVGSGQQDQPQGYQQQQQIVPRQPNRAEKKSRKALQRLGMRPVAGIARVTLKMSGKGNNYFAIHKPDVFEKNGTYIVFGEAMQGGGGGGPGGVPQQQEQQQATTQAQAAQTFAPPSSMDGPSKVTKEENNNNGGGVDETGVEAKDIELVMTQASCSRSQAVTALKDNYGDLVNAIMSLTT